MRFQLYWNAFVDLLTERTTRHSIPWSAIARYADHHGVDVDELKRVVWALDKTLRDWWVANDGKSNPART